MSLTSFRELVHDPAIFTVEHWLAKGFSPEDAQFAIEHSRLQRVYRNNVYIVHVVYLEPAGDGPGMVHLSIRRNDRRLVRDWRHLQWIKNALVGPECEAVELFPAESRLVDSADQWHLWVVTDPTFRWPFGFNDRLVADGDDPVAGTTQRPRRQEVRT